MEDRMYLPLLDGKKAAMPRYYKLKLYDESERTIIADAAQYKAEKLFKKMYDEHGSQLAVIQENSRIATVIRAEYQDKQKRNNSKI